MNKLLLSAALVAGVAGAALAPLPTLASDGSVLINGTLSATSCKVNGGSSPSNFTVQLPTVSVSSLKTAGSVAGATPFDITLTSCTAPATITTYFEPGLTVMADGNLKNTGLAKNVEVQLLNANGNVMNLSAAAKSQNALSTLYGPNSDGTGTTALTGMPAGFFAQYVAIGGAAGSGTVTTTVQYTMIYN